MGENILIKASGDIIHNTKFQDYCKDQADNIKNKIVIICGSGKQINTNLMEAGYSINYDEKGERIIGCIHEEQIVRDTLKDTSDQVAQIFSDFENIHVKGSREEVGGVYCHVNADTFILTYYLGFDNIYVFTFQGNSEKKREFFAKYPKVQIIEL